ncbi:MULTISPECIES: YqiA/YcfP family alpha/beta fold hydrolase [unclassified Acinetobacter]|uniref:YqiA/YcfP family alpha/beta fold hydrolase n=1 Tax=unclassified Acinetobacter TaxID=196816 RepID=UPI0035B9CA61
MKQIIYLHGLNSNQNAHKAQLLREYCQVNHTDIEVLSPNLNFSPPQVMANVAKMIEHNQQHGIATAIVGSSLGGFYATYLHHQFDLNTVLLNPSLYPHQSLQRFFDGNMDDFNQLNDNTVIYITKDNWSITKYDILWFMHNQPKYNKKHLNISDNPIDLLEIHNLKIYLKQGDEVLDYRKALSYFEAQQVIEKNIVVEAGGDHVMSDFSQKLTEIVSFCFFN